MYTIYIVRNTVNDRIYVGQTRTEPKHRWGQHLSDLRHGRHRNNYLQKAWNKYGEGSFEFFVLAATESKEECDDLERFYRQWFADIGLCYNLSLGGEGSQHCEESKEKIRQWHLGRKQPPPSEYTRELLRRAHTGKKMTPEQVERSCEKRRGAKRSPEAREKMRLAAIGNKSHLGHRHTEESKARISAAHRGYVMPQSQKDKIAQKLRDRKASPEARAIIGQKSRDAWARRKKSAQEAV